jgi:hypothetical protein
MAEQDKNKRVRQQGRARGKKIRQVQENLFLDDFYRN